MNSTIPTSEKLFAPFSTSRTGSQPHQMASQAVIAVNRSSRPRSGTLLFGCCESRYSASRDITCGIQCSSIHKSCGIRYSTSRDITCGIQCSGIQCSGIHKSYQQRNLCMVSFVNLSTFWLKGIFPRSRAGSCSDKGFGDTVHCTVLVYRRVLTKGCRSLHCTCLSTCADKGSLVHAPYYLPHWPDCMYCHCVQLTVHYIVCHCVLFVNACAVRFAYGRAFRECDRLLLLSFLERGDWATGLTDPVKHGPWQVVSARVWLFVNRQHDTAPSFCSLIAFTLDNMCVVHPRAGFLGRRT